MEDLSSGKDGATNYAPGSTGSIGHDEWFRAGSPSGHLTGAMTLEAIRLGRLMRSINGAEAQNAKAGEECGEFAAALLRHVYAVSAYSVTGSEQTWFDALGEAADAWVTLTAFLSLNAGGAEVVRSKLLSLAEKVRQAEKSYDPGLRV